MSSIVDTDAFKSGMSAEQRWSTWHQSMFKRDLVHIEDMDGVPRHCWDYIDKASGTSYEVKFDEASGKTGNICIELHGKHRGATGLLSSLATYYVYITPEEGGHGVHYYKREHLLDFWYRHLMTGDHQGHGYVMVERDAPAFCWLIRKDILHAQVAVKSFYADLR